MIVLRAFMIVLFSASLVAITLAITVIAMALVELAVFHVRSRKSALFRNNLPSARALSKSRWSP